MARENQDHLRQLIAQQAARMMAEDGINDFAYAKKKAGKQLGVSENSVLPTNAEIEDEIRLYHEIYNADEQPLELAKLRQAALLTMQLFEKLEARRVQYAHGRIVTIISIWGPLYWSRLLFGLARVVSGWFGRSGRLRL